MARVVFALHKSVLKLSRRSVYCKSTLSPSSENALVKNDGT